MNPRRLIISLLVLGLGFVACGCALSVLADRAVGSSTIYAKFIPPKEPTLVLVENNQAAAGAEADCDRLGRYIEQDLKEHDVVPLVDFSAATQLRERDPEAYHNMSIAALGKAVGAKQVIFVSLSDYSSDTAMGSDQVVWKAAVHVKVVDTESGESRWPKDFAEGQSVKVHTEYKPVDMNKDQLAARDDLNKTLAEQIGRLFHDWQREHDEPEDYE